jgi:hypothetical protein
MEFLNIEISDFVPKEDTVLEILFHLGVINEIIMNVAGKESCETIYACINQLPC